MVRKARVLFALGVLAGGTAVQAATWRSRPLQQGVERLRVTYVPLPRGNSTLIEAPGGSKILLGAGEKAEAPELLRFLKRRGVQRLNILMLDTWTESHVGGALNIIQGLPTRALAHNGNYIRTPNGEKAYLYARQLDTARKMQLAVPTPGGRTDLFYTPPCQVTAVAPTGPMLSRFSRDASCSLVTEFSYDRISFLNLGQTTRKHQQAFWETSPEKPEGHILTIGRAGEAQALLPGLLKPLKTRVAVIPVPTRGARKPDPALLKSLKAAGVRVYRTDQNGVVTVTTDGRGIQVNTER